MFVTGDFGIDLRLAPLKVMMVNNRSIETQPEIG